MKKLLAAFALLLAGCAAGPQTITGPKGWVVMSMVQEVAFAPAFLSIRPVGVDAEARNIGLFLTDAFSMDELDGSWGVVKAAPLRPGTYEIYNFFLEQGGTRTQYRSRQDFSLRFDVKENQVAYLGEFKATKTRTKSLADWLKGSSPYFIHSDRRARDMGVAATSVPELQGLPSQMVRLTPAKATPFVRTRRVD